MLSNDIIGLSELNFYESGKCWVVGPSSLYRSSLDVINLTEVKYPNRAQVERRGRIVRSTSAEIAQFKLPLVH